MALGCHKETEMTADRDVAVPPAPFQCVKEPNFKKLLLILSSSNIQ